jgi:hypothetical protein
MDKSQFTPEEQALLELAEQDDKRIIAAYIEGQEFDRDFIRSLNLEDSKRNCLDHNDNVKRLRYYQEQVKSFTGYIETMKTWY